MPNDDPGKLPREDYASIVAYLFKVNKMPSGRKPLPSDSRRAEADRDCRERRAAAAMISPTA